MANQTDPQGMIDGTAVTLKRRLALSIGELRFVVELEPLAVVKPVLRAPRERLEVRPAIERYPANWNLARF